jgi:hypothetical protein
VLATAVRRINSEIERRRRMRAAIAHVESAKAALAMKGAKADDGAADFNSRRSHSGMRNIISQRRIDLMRPMERGRMRKANAVAQAKRDAR